jgi:RNA polymerase sigma-70 factor (ECF subfamily)
VNPATTLDANEPAVTPSSTFEGFFEEERQRLFAALWLLTRDRHEAEEIAQDAFLRLWQRWDRVGSIDDRTAYLYRTAMNLFRNRVRRAGVAVRRAARMAPPRDDLADVEVRVWVLAALRRLTSRQRAALVLVDLLEFTSEEAGRALGVRPSTVRVLAARGRSAIRREATDE